MICHFVVTISNDAIPVYSDTRASQADCGQVHTLSVSVISLFFRGSCPEGNDMSKSAVA